MLLVTLRILAVGIVLPTLAMLWANGARDGVSSLYYLLPDIALCAALLAAAAHGGRQTLLAAYALSTGVFMTATSGALWTEGLARVPVGATLGLVVCAVVIFLLLRPVKSSQP